MEAQVVQKTALGGLEVLFEGSYFLVKSENAERVRQAIDEGDEATVVACLHKQIYNTYFHGMARGGEVVLLGAPKINTTKGSLTVGLRERGQPGLIRLKQLDENRFSIDDGVELVEGEKVKVILDYTTENAEWKWH